MRGSAARRAPGSSNGWPWPWQGTFSASAVPPCRWKTWKLKLRVREITGRTDERKSEDSRSDRLAKLQQKSLPWLGQGRQVREEETLTARPNNRGTGLLPRCGVRPHL